MNPGDDLLSHTPAGAVSSALEDLTSVFGMGTGVAPPISPPETAYKGDRAGRPYKKTLKWTFCRCMLQRASTGKTTNIRNKNRIYQK